MPPRGRFPVVAAPVRFGPVQIDPRQVFYQSRSALSVSFVNLRPLLPGHVLVASARPCARVEDLAPEEFSDMWLTARRVSSMLAGAHGASSFTFALQDGPDAGQTVPHAHIHVIPRRRGDLERNDDVYGMAERHGAADVAAGGRVDPDARDGPAGARSIDDMAREAERYAALMTEPRL